MKKQSFITKIILLVLFIIIVIALAVGFSICSKKWHQNTFPYYTATYTTDGNGYIIGDSKQTIGDYHDGTEVTAVPNDGYLFAGWSDGVFIPSRTDTEFRQDFEVSANFVSKFKTLKYDYNGATSGNSIYSVTLNYDDILSTEFNIPKKENFEFQGWYLDKEFTKRVTDKDGVYYLGKTIFYNDADTIYARWDKFDGVVYPVLMIFTDEIHAQLKTVSNDLFSLDYKMSLPELKICEQIYVNFYNCLNECFDGLVHFEIDSFYTNIPLNSDYFRSCRTFSGNIDYFIYPNMTETYPILKNYRSVLTTAGYNDPNRIIHSAAGYGMLKYATIPLDNTRYGIDFSKPMTGNNAIELSSIISTFIHEFIHTIEQAPELELNNFHEYISLLFQFKIEDQTYFDWMMLYLLNKAELNGKQTGVPFEFWTGEIEIGDSPLEYYPPVGGISFSSKKI